MQRRHRGGHLREVHGDALPDTDTIPRDTPARHARHECAQATGDVPPTINYATPDPECDLDYVPNAARKVLKPRAAISDNLGFGGHNAAIVFKAYE